MASGALRDKYSHMGRLVKALPTTDMTRVFRSADTSVAKDTSRLFFPWLGMNACEFGIGKVMCSLSHSSSLAAAAAASSPGRPSREEPAGPQPGVDPSAAEGVDSILIEPSPQKAPLRRSKRIASFVPGHGGFMHAVPEQQGPN